MVNPTNHDDIKINKKLYKKLLEKEGKENYINLCLKNNICPKCNCENGIYIDGHYLICKHCKSEYYEYSCVHY